MRFSFGTVRLTSPLLQFRGSSGLFGSKFIKEEKEREVRRIH
ncbi:unnamed protein product [Brassica rapa subsp. trilocularis]